MDFDRDMEHLMMNVRGNMGGITQTIYAANVLKLKLIQFVARMTYKGILSVKARDDLNAFSKLSGGKYTIYNIPVSSDHVKDLKEMEQLSISLQNETDKGRIKEIKQDMKALQNKIDADSPISELKDKGIKNICVLPKIDPDSGTMQAAIMNKDDQIFKNWFSEHIRAQMSGGNQHMKDLKNFTEGNYSIFNLPFEGEKLNDACRDFDTLKINYSILPDLKIGNGNSQVAVANADRNKFKLWIKMYREELLKQDKEPGNIYEMDEESYIDKHTVSY